MANTLTIVERAIANTKKIAEAFKYEVITGQSAFDNNASIVAKSYEDTLFNEGDVIHVPPIGDSWICTPFGKNNKPVTRPVCEVTDKNGNVRAQELFYGSLIKSVIHRETKERCIGAGNVSAKVRDYVLQKDGWSQLVNKKIIITKVREIPTRNPFSGREFDSYLYDIDFVK